MNLINKIVVLRKIVGNARPSCIEKSALVGPVECREAYREEYGVVGHSRHMSKRLHDEDHQRLGRRSWGTPAMMGITLTMSSPTRNIRRKKRGATRIRKMI